MAKRLNGVVLLYGETGLGDFYEDAEEAEMDRGDVEIRHEVAEIHPGESIVSAEAVAVVEAAKAWEGFDWADYALSDDATKAIRSICDRLSAAVRALIAKEGGGR